MPSLASSSGISFDPQTLSDVYETVGAIAVDRDRELRRVLEGEDSVDVSFEVVLPTRLAGPAGKALRSVDLAWRLAYVVTERKIDELDLEGADETQLDEIAPVGETGLLVDVVSTGSILARLKSQGGVDGKGVVATLNILAALSQVTGVNLQQVAHAEKSKQPQVEVKLLDPRVESVSDAIRHELPGIPPGTIVTINGTMPNGSSFTVTLEAPDT